MPHDEANKCLEGDARAPSQRTALCASRTALVPSSERSRLAPGRRVDNATTVPPSSLPASQPRANGFRRRSQPGPARPRSPRGHGRGAPRQRPAELHPGRASRYRSEGIARAGARCTADERPRVSAQQAGHGQPRARRPAEGIGPLRPADRARHPRRGRAHRRGPAGRLRIRRRAVARRRVASGARCAGDGTGAAAHRDAARAIANPGPPGRERRRDGVGRRPVGARCGPPARRGARPAPRRRRRRQRAAPRRAAASRPPCRTCAT